MDWQSYLQSPLTWIFFLFGAIVGSFLNVCILRIPQKTFWQQARSVCPHCGAPIPFYLNIPIASWLILRGRALCCRSRLSIQYPLVELFTACMFVLLYWRFAFIDLQGGFAYDANNLLRFTHATVFSCLLLVCSVIDIRQFMIPDVISIPMILVSPLVAWMHPELDLVSSLLGVVAGGFCLYAIAWIYWLIKREVAMGMGDVKLLAAIGGWIGYQGVIPTTFYGSILGSVIGLVVMLGSSKMSMKSAIPFGPFLALGAVLQLTMGGSIFEFLTFFR